MSAEECVVLMPRGIAATIALALRQDIGSGVFPPGTPLRQEEIARRFNVSQMPAREALRQLVNEGLALLLPNRGVIVAELSTADVEELIEFRILIESKLLEWAIPSLDALDFARLETLLRDVDALVSPPRIEEVLRINEEFHCCLYAKANKPFFLKSVSAVRFNLNRYLRLAWDDLQNNSRNDLRHENLLELCRKHDSDAAISFLQKHIRETGLCIIGYMNSLKDRP